MNTVQPYSPSFQARCPHIREAQNVCHIISANYPHVSDTRIRPAFYNLMEKDYVSEKFKVKYILWLRRFADKMQEVRDMFQQSLGGVMPAKPRPMKIFQQFKIYNMGNCHENALAAEAILKLNGTQNACCVNLKQGSTPIDHVVCVFNRDGSKFDGVVKNNQTIIVDPWLGKADFANNMFKFYENNCKIRLNLKDRGHFTLTNPRETNISEFDIKLMREYFSDLFYKK